MVFTVYPPQFTANSPLLCPLIPTTIWNASPACHVIKNAPWKNKIFEFPFEKWEKVLFCVDFRK